MHEIGILSQVIKSVENVAARDNIKKIDAILLEIGELSGVLPVFMEKYYPIVIEGKPLFEDSELKIEVVPGEGLCSDCHAIYNIMKFEGECPRCKSRSKTVLGGQDFVLKNVYVKI
jgi:hydrogenase nickel incorporation protein HypA/HybF